MDETTKADATVSKWTILGTTTLGTTTLRVPRMGTGVMTWGDAKGLARLHPAKSMYGGADTVEEEARAFQTCLDAGIFFFDTAALYSGGASERRLGELAQGKEVTIATKFPSSPFRFRTENVTSELQGSLARLQRTSIDLYQHHFPSNRVAIPELMNRLADAQELGAIKTIGVSNYSAEQMRQAHAALVQRGMVLASNQVEYSLLHRQPETNGILEACAELGITLIAYSPLAMGALTGKYSTGERPQGLRRFLPSFNRKTMNALQPVIDLLRQIGAKYEKSPGQIALRWLIENPLVLPIPGAKNSRQASQNVGALTFRLSPDEIDAIDHATRAWRM